MALSPEDLGALKNALKELINSELSTHLAPIKNDLEEIKKDTKLLSKLNALDEIRREPRLRRLYEPDELKEM